MSSRADFNSDPDKGTIRLAGRFAHTIGFVRLKALADGFRIRTRDDHSTRSRNGYSPTPLTLLPCIEFLRRKA